MVVAVEPSKPAAATEDGRQSWGGRIEFLLSCLGYCVGVSERAAGAPSRDVRPCADTCWRALRSAGERLLVPLQVRVKRRRHVPDPILYVLLRLRRRLPRRPLVTMC